MEFTGNIFDCGLYSTHFYNNSQISKFKHLTASVTGNVIFIPAAKFYSNLLFFNFSLNTFDRIEIKMQFEFRFQMKKRTLKYIFIFSLPFYSFSKMKQPVKDTAIKTTSQTNYLQNRAPLLQNPFVELPIGAIKPHGWLKTQLVAMKNGSTGHLDSLYSKVMGKRNGWLGGDGDVWE